MRKRWMAGLAALLILALLLSACGTTAVEEAQEEQTQQVQEETGETEDTEAEEVPEEESEPAEETVSPISLYIEDENEYGNSVGNLYNNGFFVYNTRGIFYFYNYYENLTQEGSGNSAALTDDMVVYLNYMDDVLYGMDMDGEILAIQVIGGATEVLREAGDGVMYLQAVNDRLYFMDNSDGTLRSMSITGDDEEILVNEPAYYPVVYKDRIIFQLDSDGESLYSIPIDGGEMTKLNDLHSFQPMIYMDKIYYYASDDGHRTLHVMNLDGSEDTILAEGYPINLYDGDLYYVLSEDETKIYRLDLDDETAQPEEFTLEDQIKTALAEAYGEDSYTTVQIESYDALNFSGQYLLFYCSELIDGTEYRDQYIYDMENDEIFVLPAFCFNVDDFLQSAIAAMDNANSSSGSSGSSGSSDSSTSSSSRSSYPAGDYSVGSVYGPKLNQTQLDQVADAVETFLATYDTASMDDYTKVLTAHDYLCSVCSYAPDWSQNGANTAWGALVYHQAQCSGYARAMKALCDAMGVGCYYVHADENSINPSHQWNECCVNGNWYIVDVQCNDSSGFKAYFLVSDNTYAATGMSWDRSSVPSCPSDY